MQYKLLGKFNILGMPYSLLHWKQSYFDSDPGGRRFANKPKHSAWVFHQPERYRKITLGLLTALQQSYSCWYSMKVFWIASTTSRLSVGFSSFAVISSTPKSLWHTTRQTAPMSLWLMLSVGRHCRGHSGLSCPTKVQEGTGAAWDCLGLSQRGGDFLCSPLSWQKLSRVHTVSPSLRMIDTAPTSFVSNLTNSHQYDSCIPV